MPLQIGVWWLAVSVVGWSTMPMARRLLNRLPDGGMAFARPLGLLAVGYLFWVGGLLRIVPNDSSGAFFVVAIWAAAGLWLARADGDWPAYLRARRKLVLSWEVLFAVALVLWAVFRSAAPNIEPSGGEKYMEMAFLNGVLRSDGFPPNDPWLSGHSISYYYLGYLVAAVLTQLTTVPSTVAFNLVIPTALALTLVAAGGVGYNLAALVPETSRAVRVAAATLAATLTALVGNLEGFLELAYRQGWGSPAFWNHLDIKNLTLRAASGLSPDLAAKIGCGEPEGGFGSGAVWPDRFIWWWRGSRVIHDNCGEIIHEFPFFSFMLGDVHPHVMALPFVVTAVGVGLNVLIRSDEPLPDNAVSRSSSGLWSPWWIAVAGVVGALGFLNAWDLPTFALVIVIAFALWVVRTQPLEFSATSLDAVLAGLGLGAILLAGAKWLDGLSSPEPPAALVSCQAGWLGPVCGALASALRAAGLVGSAPSPGVAFPALLAAGVLAAAAGLVLKAVYDRRRAPGPAATLHVLRFGAFLGVVAVALYLPFYIPLESQVQGIGVVATRSRPGQWLVHLAIPVYFAGSIVAAGLSSSLRSRRLSAPSLALVLLTAPFLGAALVSGDLVPAVLSVAAAAAGVAGLERWRAGSATGDPTAVPWVFALVLAALGCGLLLGVEFFFIRDLFGSRMNSVFKFDYQAWILLGLAGAFAPVVVAAVRRPVLRWIWAAAAAALIAAGLVFTVAAVKSRTAGWRERGLTLDGLQWWQASHPGALAAAAWLGSQAEGDPVIVEAASDSYQDEAHMSLATGLPTVLGWEFHERQWGRSDAVIGPRKADLERLYKSAGSKEVLDLLGRYGARYLVVGPAERSKYDMGSDLGRFDSVLTRVYDADGITIFEVPR